ncbi:hypothetical protein [Amycolatopsis taiwanensis]|uniref:hypothetical protein n=1 Tax=Amycolatopsis taiwanensis TaxID=342230 RepID=UPI00048845C7|nr:hypothetical protein [Amycolatopsis taiwanensis]
MSRDDLQARSLPQLVVMLAALLVIVAIRLIRDPLTATVRGLEAVARGVDTAATWLLMPIPTPPPRKEGTSVHP